jgi:hypothetical protein
MSEQYEEAPPLTYQEQPNPSLGEPATSLELEQYLAEPKSMMKVRDPTSGEDIHIGDVPDNMRRKLYGMLGKQVINAYFTEKDVRVKKLQNFIASIHEEMWTPVNTLNQDNGRGLLDLEQARMYANDLVTQAYYGMHSKQRTTYTHIQMAGRLDQQSNTGQKPSSGGGYFY